MATPVTWEKLKAKLKFEASIGLYSLLSEIFSCLSKLPRNLAVSVKKLQLPVPSINLLTDDAAGRRFHVLQIDRQRGKNYKNKD